jgi:hypothetical protein
VLTPARKRAAVAWAFAPEVAATLDDVAIDRYWHTLIDALLMLV